MFRSEFIEEGPYDDQHVGCGLCQRFVTGGSGALERMESERRSVHSDVAQPSGQMATPKDRKEVKYGPSGRDTDFHLEAGKDRVDLLPKDALRAAAQPFAYGLEKYGEWNWHQHRNEWEWMQLIGSTTRHLFSWEEREDVDPESGCHHLDMAIADLLMLRSIILRNAGTDNRRPL